MVPGFPKTWILRCDIKKSKVGLSPVRPRAEVPGEPLILGTLRSEKLSHASDVKDMPDCRISGGCLHSERRCGAVLGESDAG